MGVGRIRKLEDKSEENVQNYLWEKYGWLVDIEHSEKR
jgi:hypothetical protein